MGSAIPQKSDSLKFLSDLVTASPSQLPVYDFKKTLQNEVIFSMPTISSKHQGRPKSQSYHYGSSLSLSPIKYPKNGKIGIGLTNNAQTRICNREKKLIMKRLPATMENQSNIRGYIQKLGVAQGTIRDCHNNSNTIVQLMGFEREYEGFMCGNHTAVKLVFQYFGQRTLKDEISSRTAQIASTNLSNNDKLQQAAAKSSFSIQEIVRTTKFLLQVVRQLLKFDQLPCQYQTLTPRLSVSDIILLNRQHSKAVQTMIYRNPLDSLYFHQREPIQGYIKFYQQYSECQVEDILMMDLGISVMSMCLLEDCSQSCFTNTGEVCISALQNKIQQIFSKYSQKYCDNVARNFCQIIQMLTNPQAKKSKDAFNDIRSRCNKLLVEQQKMTLYKNQMAQLNSSRSTLIGKIQQHETTASDCLQMFNIHRIPHSKLGQKKLSSMSMVISPAQDSKMIDLRNINQQLSASGKLTQTERRGWQIQDSSERKIKINPTEKIRIKQWQIEEPKKISNSINNKNKRQVQSKSYIQIDKKWEDDQDLFKFMPTFSQLEGSQTLKQYFNVDVEPITQRKDSIIMFPS